jgi:putative hydrolase of the HAD superfamily
MFDLIAFDADDTLWDNERLFHAAEQRLVEMFGGQHDPAVVSKALYDTEMRNLRYFGYGIKSFTLSMVEAAVELSGESVSAEHIQAILVGAKTNFEADVQLMRGVQETVEQLSRTHDLMILTKGDLLDQEAKIARSGIAGYFKYVEIVSEKSKEGYRALLEKYDVKPERFLMIGNSIRSDVLPVAAIGATAVLVAYADTWEHENWISEEEAFLKYYELEHVGELPALIEKLQRG